MTERELLLQNCLDDPASDDPRGVYADFLREADDPLGRFLWAGVTLARYRGTEPVADGTFFDAQKERSETTAYVVPLQLDQLLGWKWRDLIRDADDKVCDRTHVSHLIHAPGAVRDRMRNGWAKIGALPAAVYERGMLTALRLPLARVREVVGAALACCPLERVEVLDVPGLSLRIGPQREPDRWSLNATLSVPRAREGFYRHFPPEPTVAQVLTAPWTMSHRANFVTYIVRAIDDTVDLLRARAATV